MFNVGWLEDIIESARSSFLISIILNELMTTMGIQSGMKCL